MKLSALTIAAAALAMVSGGSALAQATSAPVTMQPIPNPPEAAKPAHIGRHHKHHAMHAKAKAADTKTDSAAPSTK